MGGAISGKPGMKKIGNSTKYYEVSVFFLIITDLRKVAIGSFAGLADARVCVRLCLPRCALLNSALAEPLNRGRSGRSYWGGSRERKRTGGQSALEPTSHMYLTV